MNKKIFNVLMFAVGAAVGSAVIWKVVKTKYEQIAQEEIDSVKEEYSRLSKQFRKESDDCSKNDTHQNNIDEEYDEDDCHPYDEQDMIDYSNIANMYRSSCDDDDYNKENNEEGDEGVDTEVPYINGPYVISPEEFGNNKDFNVQALDYFADGVLADGWGVKLDIDETIGEDSLKHFGEYSEGIVHVRNERMELDYEVTQDPRTYYETVRTNPNPYYGQ